MAYSLFNSSAASNYLASFKPAKPVDGFDDVLSTSATDNITRMQELDYSGRVGLAKQAMVELSARLQNDALIDYYDRRDDKTMKIEKRKSLATLLGQGGVGGGGGALGSVNNFLGATDKTFAQGDKAGKGGTVLTDKTMSTVIGEILGDPNKKSQAANTQAQTQSGVTTQFNPQKLDLLGADRTNILELINSIKTPQSK